MMRLFSVSGVRRFYQTSLMEMLPWKYLKKTLILLSGFVKTLSRIDMMFSSVWMGQMWA